MEADEEAANGPTQPRKTNSGRISWPRRPGQGHSRSWARISLGGLNPGGRRRDKETQGIPGTRTPPNTRRTTLGGAVREDGESGGLLTGGASARGGGHHGRHGIRYSQSSDTWSEDLKQEESLSDPGGDRPLPTASLLSSSSSSGPVVSTVRKTTAEFYEDTIAEEQFEDCVAEEELELDEPDKVPIQDEAENGASTTGDEETQLDGQSQGEHGEGEGEVARGVDLSNLDMDRDRDAAGGPVSPTSGMSGSRRSGSISPGRSVSSRQRMHSWAPTALSPPALSGPFSRPRSKSRSPRHRMSIGGAASGMGEAATMPRLQNDFGRSSGGFERAPLLSKDPSVSSTTEEVAGWSENEIPGTDPGGGVEEKSTGPFTETSLEMARLRLPNMELGFEDEGFFGIDVRRLIIGREIARGAFGVVHEAVLLEELSPEEEGPNGRQSGSISKVTVSDGENEDPDSGTAAASKPSDGEGEPEPVTESPPPTSNEPDGEEEVQEADESTREADDETAEGEDDGEQRVNGEAGERVEVVAVHTPEAETGKVVARASVAVKIQQVPLDEEEQANLLGELAMLRNHSHPHLVEFIGTAIAIERGVDTVMLAMELCTNGALREALKLDIGWPLKVRIAADMTDGLQFLHEKGIIHRDIKTPNVLIDSSWRAKLCDYNFAIDENSTIKQDFCAGTAEFMSPEVLLSEEYGLPSDIFSLGMILVEMLTGKEPSSTFPERPPQAFFVVSEEEIQAELLEGCPSSFSLLQTQCLFSEPSERPTAEDAFGWLQDLLNELSGEEIAIPQSRAPLPVLTEGAAIAREGNVINASPKGTGEHHWFESEAIEEQINSMVERAVESALVNRGVMGDDQGERVARATTGLDDESAARLEEMQDEINALRGACEERDSRISDLEVQALRNTSTLKMLSSALEVAYKMLEGQQAARLQSHLSEVTGGVEDASGVRKSLGQDESDDFDVVEARLSRQS